MKSIILDIDMLRCFLAVVRYRGFTRAGEEIGLTQSGVSVKIKRLEERLGTVVFQRTSKSLSLTPAGEILKGYAQRILETHDEVVQRLCAPDATGSLRVGMADYFIPNILPALLNRFRQHYPKIRLEITAGLGINLLPLFDQNKLDLVVTGRGESPPPHRALVEEPLMWVIGSECEIRRDTPVPLVMLPPPCSFRRLALEILDAQNIAWEIVYTGSSIASVQAAVRAGLGVSVLPAGTMISGLRRLPLHYGFSSLPNYVIALFSNENLKSPARTLFVEYLESELSKRPQ